jgi:hypothetical protein
MTQTPCREGARGECIIGMVVNQGGLRPRRSENVSRKTGDGRSCEGTFRRPDDVTESGVIQFIGGVPGRLILTYLRERHVFADRYFADGVTAFQLAIASIFL